MILPLNTDSAATVTHPSSENLMTLIIITGGLLFICLVLLVIVVLRSKARRKKSEGATTEPQVKKAKEAKPQKQTPVKETKVEPKKQVVEVTIKKEEVKPVVEPKKEEIKPVIEVKKEVAPPKVETKLPDTSINVQEDKNIKAEPKVEIKPPVIETKKPDEVIITIEEKKPAVVIPVTTSVQEKKDHFNKVLSDTHSKEDNLKILQERLAELGKEKKTTVTFKEDEKKPEITVIKENKEETKKESTETHTKLVDLTSLINEKLQTNTSIDADKNEVTPEIKSEDKAIVENKIAEEESHKIITPFIEKINSTAEISAEDSPEKIIEKIDEELKAEVEKEVKKEEKITPPTTTPATSDTPKTFTEWLSTLKK